MNSKPTPMAPSPVSNCHTSWCNSLADPQHTPERPTNNQQQHLSAPTVQQPSLSSPIHPTSLTVSFPVLDSSYIPDDTVTAPVLSPSASRRPSSGVLSFPISVVAVLPLDVWSPITEFTGSYLPLRLTCRTLSGVLPVHVRTLRNQTQPSVVTLPEADPTTSDGPVLSDQQFALFLEIAAKARSVTICTPLASHQIAQLSDRLVSSMFLSELCVWEENLRGNNSHRAILQIAAKAPSLTCLRWFRRSFASDAEMLMTELLPSARRLSSLWLICTTHMSSAKLRILSSLGRRMLPHSVKYFNEAPCETPSHPSDIGRLLRSVHTFPTLRSLAVLGYDLCTADDYRALVIACASVRHLAVHASFTPAVSTLFHNSSEEDLAQSRLTLLTQGESHPACGLGFRPSAAIHTLEGALYVNGGVDVVHHALLQGQQIASLELQHVHYANVKFSFLDNRALVSLSLRAVTLDDSSAISLARSLSTLRQLETFCVHDVSLISLDGMDPIIMALSALPSLVTVRLSVDISLDQLRQLLQSPCLRVLHAPLKRTATSNTAPLLPALRNSQLSLETRRRVEGQVNSLGAL